MVLVNATFLVNSITGTENFVVNLPENYQFAAGERLITRQIPEEQYELYRSDKWKQLKIYRYIDKNAMYTDNTVVPKGLDYKGGLTIRLFPKPFIENNGFLRKMEYYANAAFNSATLSWDLSDKILEADFTYQIDPATEFVVARTKKVTWFREDGVAHPDTKTMFKPYSLLQMDEEAIRRRSNVVGLIKIELARFNAWALAQQFPNPATRPNANDSIKGIAAVFAPYMSSFVQAGDKSIIKFTQNLQMSFLELRIPWQGNKTVREFILSRLI